MLGWHRASGEPHRSNFFVGLARGSTPPYEVNQRWCCTLPYHTPPGQGRSAVAPGSFRTQNRAFDRASSPTPCLSRPESMHIRHVVTFALLLLAHPTVRSMAD